MTGLVAGTTYYVRAYATNSLGTTYGEELIFTTAYIGTDEDGQRCPNVTSVTDYDGNTYNTVKIGNQCWMRENLRSTHYADGTSIALGYDTSSTTPYRYYPNDDSSYVSLGGYLYNWNALMHNAPASDENPSGLQGACPNGWHIPSAAEWNQLINYLKTQNGYICNTNNSNIAKALAASTIWMNSGTTCTVGNDMNSNNATGFSALPTSTDLASVYFGCTSGYITNAYFYVYYTSLNSFSTTMSCHSSSTLNKFSVRCVYGQGVSLPTITTNTVSDIETTSAVCGGNVTADGGAAVTSRGICWSTAHNPTLLDIHTTNGNGTGMFTSQITGLYPGITYYVRAYATNSAGTVYGNEVSFTTESGTPAGDAQPCLGTPTVTDYDGHTYNTVKIGQQCWMKENLRTTHYADGTLLNQGHDTSSITPYYYYPGGNDGSFVESEGLNYNWAAALGGAAGSNSNPSGVQGICPNGWHLPSYSEWNVLRAYLINNGYDCDDSIAYSVGKSISSTEGWDYSDTICNVGCQSEYNNLSGFSAYPAGSTWITLLEGHASLSIITLNYGKRSTFWSASPSSDFCAYCMFIDYNTPYFYSSSGYYTKNGMSVRCLRNESGGPDAQLPSVTTTAISNIASTVATSGGNVTSDGGSTVLARGVCWSTSQNPTISDSYTSDGTGIGTFTSNITGLIAGTTYYVRAYAVNSVGIAYGSQMSFTTIASIGVDGQPCPNAATVTDFDGNTYNTVHIGLQCWMKENLKTTHYADGTAITLYDPDSYNTSYLYYTPSYTAAYGYLYNWYATKGPASVSTNNQGICPAGWHVPSNGEWTQLTEYVSSQSQYLCNNINTYISKALSSTSSWNSCTTTCTVGNTPSNNNATGFSALPAGCYNEYAYYYYGLDAFFWSVTESNNTDAYYQTIFYDYPEVQTNTFSKGYYFSVRCLKN